MKLEKARRIGMEVVEALAPVCDRVMVAGSVRRGKAEVKDIEIVYVCSATAVEAVGLGLWEEEILATEARVRELVEEGFWEFDQEVRRNGAKYKRLVHRAGIVVELFRAEEMNWGLQLALRTGPGEFNHLLVTKVWSGGAMPVDMKMQGGYLWRKGLQLDTPDEASFFEELGVPCWTAEERSVARLAKWLHENGRVRVWRERGGRPGPGRYLGAVIGEHTMEEGDG